MESLPKKIPHNKVPALVLVLLALAVMVFVIWRVDSAPSTSDAYASADTIDVVPEVSGRIVELAVVDNQQVKKGDLLFRIDPRPYEASLAKAEASLAALDKQIMLTQRSVDAQKYAASSVEATVAKARAAAKQASDTLPPYRAAAVGRICLGGRCQSRQNCAARCRSGSECGFITGATSCQRGERR
ncbi:multidrug resistance protein MdtN [Salmonella enterica subsp. arizonae]|nr:multidrug resistance protein MdtN [Salmonella enterica subsp. arizonae]